MFTHLVPPTRSISQSSLYPQDLEQRLACNTQVKSQLNEGTTNTTSHMDGTATSTLWSSQSILYFTVITSLQNRSKSFYCIQDQYSMCTSITLISQTHLTSYSTSDAFWISCMHSTWCSGLWGYRREQCLLHWHSSLLGNGRKDPASETVGPRTGRRSSVPLQTRIRTPGFIPGVMERQGRICTEK